MMSNDEEVKNNQRKVLVLFAHPAMHLSKMNKQLVKAYEGLDGVTFHDLYETYPRFFINIKAEQALLTSHDIIIFHYPLHWYNFPPLLKHWQDIVLTTEFALRKQNASLAGKLMLNVLTTGGKRESYDEAGKNHYEIKDYLIHAEQMARICQMQYLPPFVVHNSLHSPTVAKAHKFSSFLRLTVESLQYMSDEEITKLCDETYINDDLTAFIESDASKV